MASVLHGRRVLVVDDDPDMQRLSSLVLAQAGAVVLPVGSATAAIEAFSHFRPHLVVSDLGLPGLDGIGLIRLIRALPRHEGGRTPAILVTGDSNGSTRRKALLAGYDAFLCKPVAPRELLEAGSSALRCEPATHTSIHQRDSREQNEVSGSLEATAFVARTRSG